MWGFRWVGRLGKGHSVKHSSDGGGSTPHPIVVLLVAGFVIATLIAAVSDMHHHPSRGYLPPGCHWITVSNQEVIPDCPSYHTPLPNVTPVTLPAQLPALVPIERVPIPPSTTTVPKSKKSTTTTSTTAPPGPPPKGCYVFAPNQLVCGGTIVHVP